MESWKDIGVPIQNVAESPNRRRAHEAHILGMVAILGVVALMVFIHDTNGAPLVQGNDKR